jgi:hypothetical protein
VKITENNYNFLSDFFATLENIEFEAMIMRYSDTAFSRAIPQCKVEILPYNLTKTRDTV